MARSLRRRAGQFGTARKTVAKRLTLLALCGLVLPGFVSAQERPPIIDMHLHANSVNLDDDGVPLSRPCHPMPCPDRPGRAKTAKESLDFTLEAMERHNIVLGFLSHRQLDNIYRWVEAAPDRFIASVSVLDPDLIDLAELRKEYEAGRLNGLLVGQIFLDIRVLDREAGPHSVEPRDLRAADKAGPVLGFD